jgi:GNAT superfamily N-acetyltransferase
MEIRPFRADDEERLREVARASKAHWGYDAERVTGELAKLDELGVEPEWIGCGVGSTLFRFAAARAASLGASRLDGRRIRTRSASTSGWEHGCFATAHPSEWGRILP